MNLARSFRLALCGALGLATAACEGRPSASGAGAREPLTGPTLVELNLTKGIPEQRPAGLFGSSPGGSHADLLNALGKLEKKDTKGIFVRLGGASPGLAISLEVGNLLGRLRDKNVPVVCHADGLSNASYVIAARGCSEVWLSPAGGVDTVGIAAQLLFGKSLLEKLDVGVDFLQVGKFKGAQEPYTRDEPSPEARESLESTLRDLRKAWLDAAGKRNGKDVSAALEDGPHTASAAVALGLIDKIGYADEARDQAKKRASAVRTEVAFGGSKVEQPGIGELLRGLAGGDATTEPHVAVVRATGAITMGGGGGLLGDGAGISEQSLGRTINDLTEDDAVKAVVLRIDSPGGSALASDLLWHRLMKLREEKPLVISVGGMAASGGYYLSCAGTRIFAEPTSIVGSIGVVGGKFAVGDTLRNLGVNAVTVPASPDPIRAARATYMSPFERWDDATREKMLVSMQGIYDTFIDRIAEGRSLPKDVVAASAEGRIFGGETARDRKLIDEIGGLSDAIADALERASLGKDGRVRIVGDSGNLVNLFAAEDEEARAAAVTAAARRAAAELGPLAAMRDQLPESVFTWIASAMPLARGEHALVAVPFAVTIE